MRRRRLSADDAALAELAETRAALAEAESRARAALRAVADSARPTPT